MILTVVVSWGQKQKQKQKEQKKQSKTEWRGLDTNIHQRSSQPFTINVSLDIEMHLPADPKRSILT